jgi:hypothetical protein
LNVPENRRWKLDRRAPDREAKREIIIQPSKISVQAIGER